jgi:hypothetical protein
MTQLFMMWQSHTDPLTCYNSVAECFVGRSQAVLRTHQCIECISRRNRRTLGGCRELNMQQVDLTLGSLIRKIRLPPSTQQSAYLCR